MRVPGSPTDDTAGVRFSNRRSSRVRRPVRRSRTSRPGCEGWTSAHRSSRSATTSAKCRSSGPSFRATSRRRAPGSRDSSGLRSGSRLKSRYVAATPAPHRTRAQHRRCSGRSVRSAGSRKQRSRAGAKALKPALSDQRRQVPQSGPLTAPLSELLDKLRRRDRRDVSGRVLPPPLGLRIGTIGHSKTSPEARRAAAPPLLAWCSDNGVVPDDELVGQILDGFGPGSDGEDQFDAVVGLLGMIATVRRGSEPDLPDDPAVRQIEGWMFGQPAPSSLPAHAHAPPCCGARADRDAAAAAGHPRRPSRPPGTSYRATSRVRRSPDSRTASSSDRTVWPAAGGPNPPSKRAVYHDEEWGVPNDNDRLLFDQLCVQVIQGGLSWVMVLAKRTGHATRVRGLRLRAGRALRRNRRRSPARGSRDSAKPAEDRSCHPQRPLRGPARERRRLARALCLAVRARVPDRSMGPSTHGDRNDRFRSPGRSPAT